MEENKNQVEDFREDEEMDNAPAKVEEKKGFLTKVKAAGSKIMNIKVKDVLIVGAAAVAVVGGVFLITRAVASNTSPEETTDDTTDSDDEVTE